MVKGPGKRRWARDILVAKHMRFSIKFDEEKEKGINLLGLNVPWLLFSILMLFIFFLTIVLRF